MTVEIQGAQIQLLGGGHTGDDVADRIASCVVAGSALVRGFADTAALGQASDARPLINDSEPQSLNLQVPHECLMAFRAGLLDPIRLHCAIRVGTWIYFVDSLARHGPEGHRRRLAAAEVVYGAERPAERRVMEIGPPSVELSPINEGEQDFVTVCGQAMVEAATDGVPPKATVQDEMFMGRWFPLLYGARMMVSEGKWALTREHDRMLGKS